MSSITFADNKLGGRLVAACDAIGAGHLRRAAGIFNEIADDLNGEAEAATGLLAEDDAPDPISGWRTCEVCGSVNVAPPGDGPIDMGARM
jgi:hypothetical protein